MECGSNHHCRTFKPFVEWLYFFVVRQPCRYSDWLRRYPGSKIFPQFGKEQMSKEFMKKKIAYIHIEKLGGRRKHVSIGESWYDNSGWKNKSFRAYHDYMTTAPFNEAINEILSPVGNYDALAIMCAEALAWRCHRRMIGDYICLVESICVYNIIENKQQVAPHNLASFARLCDSKTITYLKLRSSTNSS